MIKVYECWSIMDENRNSTKDWTCELGEEVLSTQMQNFISKIGKIKHPSLKINIRFFSGFCGLPQKDSGPFTRKSLQNMH